jgi:hypothetical protein
MRLQLSLFEPMLVDVIKLYLIYLTCHPVLFGYVFFVRRFTGLSKPVPPYINRIVVLRYILWLVIAGIGWLLLATNLLYWGVVFVTSALDMGVYYLTLGMAKRELQRRAGTGAA